MQAQIRTRNHNANGACCTYRTTSSYTCPRCRQYGEEAPCSRCGWTPETQAQSTNPMAGHEDRIIAC